MSFSGKRFYLDGERVKLSKLSAEDLSRVEAFDEVQGGGEEDGGEANADNIPITLKVRDQGGEETSFRVKKITKMSKIFDAYTQRKGVSMEMVRFMLDDGRRVNAGDTPKMLELEDNDIILFMIRQEGGL